MRPLATLLTALYLLVANTLSFPVLSEFMASNESTLPDEDGDFPDWIEIANMGNATVDLAGYHLTDNPEELTRWTFPPISLAAGSRLIVFASGKDRTNPSSELHTDFQLDAGGEYLALVAPDGITIATEFSPIYPPQTEDRSYGLSSFTGGVSETFVSENATGKYFIPVDGSIGNQWHQAAPQFDDSSWSSGIAGFGWETSGGALATLVRTDIRDAMRNQNSSGFFRFEFDFNSTDREIQKLTLNTRIDDGYVIYINGTQVADYNAPVPASWNSRSTRSGRSDTQVVANAAEHDITEYAQLVQHGPNVLAIHGMNSSIGGSDFLIKPELIAGIRDKGTKLRGFFDTPSPGNPNSAGSGSGPIFVEYTDKPERPAPGSDLVITAEVIGINSPVSGIELIYRVMFGNEQTLQMVESPAGSNTYTASIPANSFSSGEMIRWRFKASDDMGFETIEPPFPSATDSHRYVGTAAIDPAVQTKLPVVELFLQNPAAAGTTAGTRGAIFYLGELYDNVRLDRHGQSTGGFIKKSFNIDFNKTQRFRWNPDEKRVKDIDLLTNWADKSKVRHVFSYEVMRNSGVHAHFAYTVRVQQNGDFFSTADFVEDADDIYLERAGLNPEGVLYKVYNNQLNNTSNSGGVEKKNRRDENNADLQGLLNGLNNNSGTALWNYIYDNVNIPMCINMCAANCVIRNTDMHRKNWYLYRDTGRSDEWAILPWDLDLAHGRKWNGSDTYFDNNLFSTGVLQVGTSVKLVSLLWGNPVTRDMLMRRIRTLSDQFLQPPGTPYAERYLERRLDEQAALIDPPEISPSDARSDFMKWGSWIQSNGAQVPYTSTHPDVEDMAEGIARWKNEYLPGRRAYIYGQSAGLPESQSGQISFVFTPLLTSGATARTKVPEDGSDGTAWTLPGFDDSQWISGTTGIGFDSVKYLPLIGTDTKAAMRNIQASSYSRIEFEVTDPSTYQGLQLRMKYDDGFIAYINGTRVHQMNSPASSVWNSTATTSSQEADINAFEVFDISHHLDTLVEGTNILAIHGMNGSTGSSDFLILPELYAGIADSEGSNEPLIKFGEIEFNPVSRNQDEEFVELINDNDIAVDVSDWKVSGGIEMEIPSGTVIPAGGNLYLSPNARAFRARLNSPRGGQSRFVVGAYSGHLSNLGETLNLDDAAGLRNNTASYIGDPSNTQLYLVVSEIHYHPLNNGLAEFIEVMNISNEVTLDLTGTRFTDGIEFDFTSGSITSLGPGERVLVVRDVDAFELEFGSGLPVTGTFSGGGALSNGGERIKLEDAENGTIRQFEYNDKSPWPTNADGGGTSLTLIAPETSPDHQLPASWTSASPSPGSVAGSFPGNPGEDKDGDGLNAFLEYALATDDNIGNSSDYPISFSLINDERAFSYRRNKAATDLIFTVETSTDLVNWIDAASLDLVEVSTADNGDGSESVTLRLAGGDATQQLRAFRLKVTH
jgi:hypothetical protein